MGAPARPAARGFAMPRPGASEPAAEPEDARPVPLPADAKVDLGAQEQALRIAALLDRLDGDFVGLAPVKDRVREIAALLLIDRLRQGYGLASSRPSLHMCFTGSPGTGKTTLAACVGELDGHRPAVGLRVADLRGDLAVGEIGQVREGALSDPHGCSVCVNLAVSNRGGGHDVRGIGGLVVEGDLAPGVEGDL